MGLREPFMVKTVYGDKPFSLKAEEGKSLLVTDIFVYNPATNYITISTAQTTVGFWRVGGNLGNHLGLPIGSLKHSHGMDVDAGAASTAVKKYELSDAFGVGSGSFVIGEDGAFTSEANIVTFGSIPALSHQTILGLLRKLGHFKGYPIETGQTMIITGAQQALALVMVFYQVYDAGDMKRTDPNGSEASEFVICNYGRVADETEEPPDNVTITGDTIFKLSHTPAEFDAFPFGERAPANKEIELLALLASDVVDDRGADDTMNTEYIKFVYERTTLFDAERNGLLLKGIIGDTDAAAQIGRGLSIVGNFSDVDGKPPFIFDPPRKYGVNEELGVYVATAAGTAQAESDLLIADLEIGLIERIKRIK